ELFDVAGRRLRTAFLAPGEPFAWDGRDAGGRPAPPGLYAPRWSGPPRGAPFIRGWKGKKYESVPAVTNTCVHVAPTGRLSESQAVSWRVTVCGTMSALRPPPEAPTGARG